MISFVNYLKITFLIGAAAIFFMLPPPVRAAVIVPPAQPVEPTTLPNYMLDPDYQLGILVCDYPESAGRGCIVGASAFSNGTFVLWKDWVQRYGGPSARPIGLIRSSNKIHVTYVYRIGG